VLDASRAVGVTSALLSDEQRDGYVAGIRAEYDTIRTTRGAARQKELIPLAEARANRLQLDLTVSVPVPTFTGIRTFTDWPLADIARRIDWTPFFRTWELAGHYPAILQDPVVGEAARNLFADAQAMLDRIVREQLLDARAVVGFWPANGSQEEILLYTDAEKQGAAATLHMQRQQFKKSSRSPNRCLADYVAPVESGITDYVGAFAVTTGHGVAALAKQFTDQHDDYSAIMAQSLADRLAEAFAERLHEVVRTELWGYAAGEQLENDALVREEYQGIRPAPGYPACPVHAQKEILFRLLDAPGQVGMQLTESWAMLPAASVSGWYFWRPEAKYFGVGDVGEEQK